MKVSSTKDATESTGRIKRVLRGERVDPPPFWYMRQAGRYLPEYRAVRNRAGDFLSLCLTPDMAAEVTLQPVNRFDVDAAIVFADILLIPYALGQSLEYVEGTGPVLEPIRQLDDLAELQPSDVREKLDGVFQTVHLVRRELSVEKSLIGFAGAPWTVAAYMVEGRGGSGFANAKRWAFKAPDSFARLVDTVTQATIDYLNVQIEAGADAVQIFDSWAGLLPWQCFDRWVIEATRRIVEGVRKEHPYTPIIGFPRGVGAAYTDYAGQTGITAIGVDESVSPAWLMTACREDLVYQGNLDPQAVVIGGKEMKAAAAEVVRAFGERPHIFNLGHGIIPETPPEHVAELSAFIRAGAR